MTDPRVLHLLLGAEIVDGGAERVAAALAGMNGVTPGMAVSTASTHAQTARFFRRLPSDCQTFAGVPDVATIGDWRRRAALQAAVRDFSPDICQVHLFTPNYSALVPLVIHRTAPEAAIVLHDHLAWRPPPSTTADLRGRCWAFRISSRRRFAERAVSAVIAASSDVREVLIDFWKVTPDLITVIPNATALPDSPVKVREHARPAVILTVGALRDQKRMHLAVSAAADLKRSGTEFTWHIVGEGPLKDDLRRQIEAEGVEDVIKLEGWRDDVTPWLEKADIFVLLSSIEGLCLAVLEAMAHGLPLLLTPGAAGSLAVDRESITDLEPAAIAARLRQLIGDGDLRRRLGAGARSLVERQYSLPTYFEQMRTLYAQVAPGAKATR